MKKFVLRALLLGCLSATLAVSLKALSFGDARSIGLINDGIPSNPSDEVGYINNLIGMAAPSGPLTIGTETYTRTSNVFVPLPPAVVAGSLKQDNSNTTFDLGTGGFTYLLAKYDAANAGSYVWYVAGLTGIVTLPGTFSNGQFEISHSTAFNPGGGGDIPGVPDGGTTVALLGLGLAVLAMVQRRLALG